jgi:hypothetical protein
VHSAITGPQSALDKGEWFYLDSQKKILEINFTSYTREEFEKEGKKDGSFLNLVLEGKILILKGTLNA